MKTLLQLARDKLAEKLIQDGKDVSTLVEYLPNELVLKVANAIQKKHALSAMESGDVDKLVKAFDQVGG